SVTLAHVNICSYPSPPTTSAIRFFFFSGRAALRDLHFSLHDALPIFDVEPRAVPLRQVRHRGDRIEIAGVHLAGASDHDRRGAVQRHQRGLERLDVEAADAVASEPVHLRAADTEHPERLPLAPVDLAAAEHGD